MNVILKISLRNLIRQKRRNILLGIGIAFGTCILIIANAFSYGLTDILFNKIISYAFGHMIVSMQEKDGDKTLSVIRDQERIKQVTLETVEGVDYVRENVSLMARGIGTGKSEMMMLVGVAPDEGFYESMPIDSGNIRELENTTLENPIVLYDTLAKDLNVTLHGSMKAKFQTVYGQSQTARFTVVAILKANNPFMGIAAFVHLNTLKPLAGFQPQETMAYSINMKKLNDPRVVLNQANRLYTALTPNVAGYRAILQGHGIDQAVSAVSILPEDQARAAVKAQLQLAAGDWDQTVREKRALMLSQPVAEALGVHIGEEVTLTYATKFEGPSTAQTYQVGAIFTPTADVKAEMVFLSAEAMYDTFFPALPKEPVRLEPTHPLFASLLKEWKLLERSPTSTAFMKKQKDLRNSKWHGAVLDVTTMYEFASMILQLENILNIVTLIAGLILFFIILIGVVNTLRMTIRERTREIGTTRAIGMQQGDVRWSFITEVLLLTLFASAAGVILAFIVMQLASLPTIQDQGMFSMFLVDKHLYFLPTAGSVVINMVLIFLITLVTAYFPSRRAAKLSVASALRHFE